MIAMSPAWLSGWWKCAWWLTGTLTVSVFPPSYPFHIHHIPIIYFEINTTGCCHRSQPCILIILFIDVAEVAGMSMGTRAELQVQMSHAMQLGQAEAPLHVAGRAG